MTEKLSRLIYDKFFIESKNSNQEKEILLFGLTRILEDIPKYIMILILSLMLNIFNEVIFVLVITAMYKTFVGGAHCKDNFSCLIYSTLYFILPTLITKYINFDYNFSTTLLILNYFISLYVILYIAPADTENIPILNKKHRKKLKIFAFLSINILYIAIILNFKYINFVNLFNLVIFVINFNASKVGYKIYNCKYGFNYLKNIN